MLQNKESENIHPLLQFLEKQGVDFADPELYIIIHGENGFLPLVVERLWSPILEKNHMIEVSVSHYQRDGTDPRMVPEVIFFVNLKTRMSWAVSYRNDGSMNTGRHWRVGKNDSIEINLKQSTKLERFCTRWLSEIRQRGYVLGLMPSQK